MLPKELTRHNNKIANLLAVAQQTPKMKVMVCMDPLNASNASDQTLLMWAKDKQVHLVDFAAVLRLGEKHPHPNYPPHPEDLATICYTSGTTGDPKGAMLPHRCFLAPAVAVSYCGMKMSKNDVMISYLPLAHCYERVFEAGIYLSKSVSISRALSFQIGLKT